MKKHYYIYFDGVVTQICSDRRQQKFGGPPEGIWRSLSAAKKDCARILKKVKKEIEDCERKMEKLTESDVDKQKLKWSWEPEKD